MADFKDDKLEYIESDIKKIQMKTGMYISYVGAKGAQHLGKEAIQNAIDECDNKNSPAKNIIITCDKLEDSLTVEDDGRGIPEDNISLDTVCTKLQSGSKFTREQSGKSAGENGVGLTAINALSSQFSLGSFRDGQEHLIVFEEGDKKDDIRRKSKKEHGTIVKFSPSKKYLGKSAKIIPTDLLTWVENISYFIPDKCKIQFNIRNGLKEEASYKIKKKNFEELIKSKVDNMVSQILTFECNEKMKEDVIDSNGKKKTVNRDLTLQFSFVYSDTLEPYIDSYCNYINTTSGGVHLEAVKEAIWRFFMKKANDSLTEKEKEKWKILKVDIEQGLNIVVNLFTDMQMQLVGQTKNAVGNDELYDPIKKLVTDSLTEYFDKNKTGLSNITKLIKTNCRARIEAAKVRTTIVKDSKDKFDKFKFDKFTPCNNDGKEYKELFLCEGDSAANCLIDGRDPDTQAFFALRGMVKNGFKGDLNTILENAEWNTYIRLLKTNWGSKFDINKLYYDKIIIATDSDIDGFAIRSGIGLFHALYLPEIIKAGKLYVVLAPLYHIDDKNTPFVRSKHEYVEIYQNKIIKNYKVILVFNKSNKPISSEEFKEFIYDTQEYSDELIRLSKHFSVNKFLIERVIAYLTMNYYDPAAPSIHPFEDMNELFSDEKVRLDFIEAIQRKFPEIVLKGKHSLRGIIDGRFQSIDINSRFIKKVSDLVQIYNKYGYSLLVKEKDSDYQEMSIGEFFDNANKFRPRIISRFKGLGEATSEQLWETTLNPDNRILIQLTMEDIERDIKVFNKLHGQSKEDGNLRKLMMSSYKIRRDDLDN